MANKDDYIELEVTISSELHEKLYETSIKEKISLTSALEKSVEYVILNREKLEKNGDKIYA